MAIINFDHHPQFFTATILDWKYLLVSDTYKDIIIESLRFLVKEKKHCCLRFCTHAQSYTFNLAGTGRL